MNFILSDRQRFFEFFRVKYKLFHQSNVFFRDVHFAVYYYSLSLGKKLGYTEAEVIAREFTSKMEEEKIFKKTSLHGWTVNMPEYATSAQAQQAG